MAKFSALGAALTDDVELKAKFVDIWRRPPAMGSSPLAAAPERTPIAINDIAWELGIGQAKAAISMKYWEKAGLVRRTNARTEQAEYEPTAKLLEMFPEGGVQVMPEPEDHETPSGAVVRGETQREARSWKGDRIAPRRPVRGIVGPKKHFAGYLEEGEDDGPEAA